MDDDSSNQALLKAGFHHKMSILSGFRGPRGPLFRGTRYEYLYKAHGYFGLFIELFYLPHLVLTFAMDFTSTFDMLVLLITVGVVNCTINFLQMEFNRSKFIRLLMMNEAASIDEYYEEDLAAETKIWADRAYKLQPFLYFAVTAPILPWSLSTIINEIFGHIWGPRNVSVQHWMPYDIQKMHIWLLVEAMQGLAGLYGTLMIVMFNAVFFCLSFRIIALLAHLKKTFKNIICQVIHVDSSGNVWYTNYHGETVHREDVEDQLTSRLKSWIVHHQQVKILLNELQSLFSFPMFLNFCHAGSALASGAAAVSNGNRPPVEYGFIALYLSGMLFTLFVNCRIGDHLRIETSEILDNLAGQNYFMLSKSQRTLLKTLLIGSKSPFIFKVVRMFPLNTDTFKSIVMTTYSFYTLFIRA